MKFYIFLHAKFYFKKPKLQKRVEFVFLNIYFFFGLKNMLIMIERENIKTDSICRRRMGELFFFITAFDVTIKLRSQLSMQKLFLFNISKQFIA